MFFALVIYQSSCTQISKDEISQKSEQVKVDAEINLPPPPPPPPPLPPGAVNLKKEVDSLYKNREKLIYKLMDNLSGNCIKNDSDRIVIQMHVNQIGMLDSSKIFRSNVSDANLEKKVFECIESILDHESLFLGELKSLPNAVGGPKNILYTLPIRK